MKTTKTIIFLREKESGLPVRLLKEETNSDNCCGEFMSSLNTYNESLPIWYTDNVLHAQWVIMNSTVWYNSDERQPSHEYEADDLEICKRIETVETEDTLLCIDNTADVKLKTLFVLRNKLHKYGKNKNDRKIYERLIKEAEEGKYTLGLFDLLEGSWDE